MYPSTVSQSQPIAGPSSRKLPADPPRDSSIPAENALPANEIQVAGAHAAAADGTEQARNADAAASPPLPRVTDSLDNSWQILTTAVHALPASERKETVLSAMAQCGKKVAKAQDAAAKIEFWDTAQARELRIKHQELLRLRSEIKECSQSVTEALQDLDHLATQIDEYPDNESPSTKAMVLASIAGVAGALAMLIVTVAFPPLGLVLLGGLAFGGAAGGGYLIHKICQAASAHEGFEKANSNVSGYLRQSLEQANALERRFNSELIPALMKNANVLATEKLQEFLDAQIALAPFEQNDDSVEARQAWRNDVYQQLVKDLPRDQSELVYPCEIGGEPLLPHGRRIGVDEAMTIVGKKIEAAAGDDIDTADALLYLVAQRPRNAVENAAKMAASAAIGLPSGIPIAGGSAINLVQIVCDESGKAVGGKITYKLYHPDREHGAPLHIMPPGVGEPTLAPEDADLLATATFKLEGRNIKVTSFDFRASVSLLATCAEIYANDIHEQALSGRADQFVFPDAPLASSSRNSAEVAARAW